MTLCCQCQPALYHTLLLLFLHVYTSCQRRLLFRLTFSLSSHYFKQTNKLQTSEYLKNVIRIYRKIQQHAKVTCAPYTFQNGQMTHEVDCSEASMTDLPQVCEELLGVLPEEQLSHLRVLQAPGPHTRRHGQRLDSEGHTSRETFSFCFFLNQVNNI